MMNPQRPAFRPGSSFVKISASYRDTPVAPATPSSSAANPAATLTQLANTSLHLEPILNGDSGVCLLVEEQGVHYRFPVHRVLLVYSSQWFKVSLEMAMEQAKESDFLNATKALPPQVIRTVKNTPRDSHASSSPNPSEALEHEKSKVSATIAKVGSQLSRSSFTEVLGPEQDKPTAAFDLDIRDESDLFGASASPSSRFKKVPAEIRICFPAPPVHPSISLPNILLPSSLGANVRIIQHFLVWLYSRTGPYIAQPPMHPTLGFSVGDLMQLYNFCKRVGAYQACNFCIESIQFIGERGNTGYSGVVDFVMGEPEADEAKTCMIKWVYEEIKGEDGLKKLLVDQMVWRGARKWLMGGLECYPKEFLRDLALGAMSAKNWKAVDKPPFESFTARQSLYWMRG